MILFGEILRHCESSEMAWQSHHHQEWSKNSCADLKEPLIAPLPSVPRNDGFRVAKFMCKHAIFSFLRFITLIVVLLNPLRVMADVSIRDILTTLSSISCESLFMVTELYYPQTCVPQVSSEMLSILLSNPAYPWAKARLIMNSKLFKDNCDRKNRADYYNPKIDFGFCSNIKLLPLRTEALGSVIGGLITNVISGNNPWDDIKKDWFIPPAKYIDEHKNVSPGKIGFIVDANLYPIATMLNPEINPANLIIMTDKTPMAVFPWKTTIRNDQICVNTMSLVGWIPVGCKFILDPYLYSKYHYFFHSAPITDPNAVKSGITFEQFSNSCYTNAMSNSKALVSMSGPIITCINQSLTQMLVSKALTRVDQVSDVSNNPTARATSTLYTFQQNMRFIVTTLLTLYVIFIGFDILLGGGNVKKGDMIRYVVKLILVAYFSIGINLTPNVANSTPNDGITDWILPIVFGGANQLAQMVMSLTSGVNGLCYFDPNNYAKGYGYLALWDTLDCRVANYLGMDALADFASVADSGKPTLNSLSFSIPPWVFLIIPVAITGNMTLIGLVLAFPFLVISVASYMVYSFMVCSISITILSVLAPIIIPMVLFEYTKSYFDAWMKLMISFVLQPMIVCVFMTTMFAVYDFGFFGACKFRSVNVSQSVEGVIQTKKLFVIDNNPAIYNDSQKASCVYSLGYMFNAPFSFIGSTLSGVADGVNNITQDSQNSDPTDSPDASAIVVTDGNGNAQAVGTTSAPGQKFEDTKSKHSFLSGIKTKVGLFFSYPVLHGGIKQFTLTLFTALFALYLMYNLSTQVASFAADMTEGVVIPGAHVQPEFGEQGGGGGDESKDTASTGGGDESKDTASTGGGDESKDTASTGRGGAQDTALKIGNTTSQTLAIENGDSSSNKNLAIENGGNPDKDTFVITEKGEGDASFKPRDPVSGKPAQDAVVMTGGQEVGAKDPDTGAEALKPPSTGSTSTPAKDTVVMTGGQEAGAKGPDTGAEASKPPPAGSTSTPAKDTVVMTDDTTTKEK